MTPKRILVPFVGSDHDFLGFDVARKLACQFHAHVDALFVRPNPVAAHVYANMDEDSQEDLQAHYRQLVDEEGRRAAARARRQFNAACKNYALPKVKKPASLDQATARLLVALGETAEQVLDEAKLADLVIFAGHWVHHHQIFPSLLENVLLESGAPALFCPAGQSEIPPRRAVIGWDGSVQAARAVRAAAGFLAMADAICVVSVDEGGTVARDPRQVVDYLAWRGLEAESRIVRCDYSEVGKTLLTEAAAFQSHFLVLGGYVHARIREIVLGGTTLYVLHHCDTPMLIVH
jgi:nucleotide-binding universal stress UspA family protein